MVKTCKNCYHSFIEGREYYCYLNNCPCIQDSNCPNWEPDPGMHE